MLALSAMLFRCGYPIPELNHRFADGRALLADQFVFTVGLPVPNPIYASWVWCWSQAGRMLLPLAVAGIVLLRNRQLSQRPVRLVVDGC
jgi:hypothetical protein